jgi:hypothetical protein
MGLKIRNDHAIRDSSAGFDHRYRHGDSGTSRPPSANVPSARRSVCKYTGCRCRCARHSGRAGQPCSTSKLGADPGVRYCVDFGTGETGG